MGLLLLRLAVGVALGASCVSAFSGANDWGLAGSVLGLLAVASGVALLVGAYTPAAGILAAVATLGSAVASTVPAQAGGAWRVAPGDVLVIVVSVALVMLGPGAFSVDARLYGRREIVLPRVERSAGSRAPHNQDPPASS